MARMRPTLDFFLDGMGGGWGPGGPCWKFGWLIFAPFLAFGGQSPESRIHANYSEYKTIPQIRR